MLRRPAWRFPHILFPIPAYRPHQHGGAVQADGITSANTVGYSTQNVVAGQFYMVAVQFADVGASADVANFNKFFATTCAAGEYGDGEDTTMGNAPQIQVLNAGGLSYTKYYYISDAYDAEDNPVSGNCWADVNGYIVTGTQVPVGQSFWVKSASSGTFTFGL